MVTRKPVGSRIQTFGNEPALTTNPPYPTTPTLAPARTTTGQNVVSSPDSTKSPAFDLIDMHEARQQRSRSNSDASHGTWDSDGDEQEEGTPEEEAEMPKPLRVTPSKQNIRDGEPIGEQLPSVLRPGPVNGGLLRPSQEYQRYEEEAGGNPWAGQGITVPENRVNGRLESNNPYRQQNGYEPQSSQAAWQAAVTPPHPSKAPPAPPVELPTMHTPSEELAHLSLNDRAPPQPTGHETAEVLPVPQPGVHSPAAPLHLEPSFGPSDPLPSTNPWKQQPSAGRHMGDEVFAPPPGPPPKAPLAPPQYAPPEGSPPTQSTSRTHEGAERQSSRLAAISTTSSVPSQPSESMPETPGTKAKRQRNEHYQIKHVNWRDASHSADARFKDQIRSSPILTQNANGPCPLLALVNALVLSTPQNVDTALIETLRSREQVSLGLLLDAVFDELMSGRRGDMANELPDVSELYSFLLALHTGMNVNPRFVTPAITPRGSLDDWSSNTGAVHPVHRAQSKAGCFEETKEMRLYSTFAIPLIHGWTAPKDTPAYVAFERSAPTFEDAQNIQFAEAELEDKLRAEGLNETEQQTLQDIQTIKSFLSNWPTQLTDYGLQTISSNLKAGQIAILFRNDHFSTIYKEPTHGALMTLVTDAGYASHDEIVWESLVDVNGAACEMFSGDFRVVSHNQDARLNQGSSAGGEEGWETVQSRSRYHRSGTSQANNASHDINGRGTAISTTPPPLPGPRPTSRQGTPSHPPNHDDAFAVQAPTKTEQEDHDLALALQLQEEEEASHREAESRRRREQQLSEEFLSAESPTSPEGPRPPIPPRRSPAHAEGLGRTNVSIRPRPAGRPSVNRRADDNGAEAPPSYEQAASDRPYRPSGSAGHGQGRPLDAYDALLQQQRQQQFAQSSATVNSMASGGGGGGGAGRRRSEGARVQRRRSSQVGGPLGNGVPPMPQRVEQAAGVKDAEDKCVMM